MSLNAFNTNAYYMGDFSNTSVNALSVDNINKAMDAFRNLDEFDHPFNTIEKDNKKILQFEAIGLNKENTSVEKKFINKTNKLQLIVKGLFYDNLTDWTNEININLDIQYLDYNKITWNIKDGILNVILHEVINEEPEVEVVEEENI